MAILDFRNTPLQGLNASPAQLLMGRRTRTTLPTKAQLLQPRTVDVKDRMKERRRKIISHHDKQAKDLPILKEGESVTVRPQKGKTWEKATVTERVDDRSYKVKTGDSILRRNRVFIRSTPKPSDESQPGYTTPDLPASTSNNEASTSRASPNSLPTEVNGSISSNGRTSDQGGTPVRPRRTRMLPKRLQDFVVG